MRRRYKVPIGDLYTVGVWLDVGGVNGDYCRLVMRATANGRGTPVAAFIHPRPRQATWLAKAYVRSYQEMLPVARWLVEERV